MHVVADWPQWLPRVSKVPVAPRSTLMRRVGPLVLSLSFCHHAQRVTRHLKVQGHRPASFLKCVSKKMVDSKLWWSARLGTR